jgi:hypothetical protein
VIIMQLVLQPMFMQGQLRETFANMRLEQIISLMTLLRLFEFADFTFLFF